MKKFFQRYWFLILLAFLATSLFLIKALSPPLPLVARLDPASGLLAASPEKIIVSFKKQQKDFKPGISLSVSPEAQFSLSWQGEELIINCRAPLTAGEKYLFELRYKGKPFYVWSYQIAKLLPTPTPTPVSEKGNPKSRQEITNRTLEQYPLIKFMPYENEDFYVNYSGPLTLGVKIKKGDKEKVKWEVYDWLQKKGADPGSHKIIWL